ncbi:MAG: FHA domain-containing protein [Pyrinomonadaceae bacterium]|nr:FHA domain-containing protein [Pyrinomonadaceae bacterium]
MSDVQLSTFIITREDRPEDEKQIVSEGLRIGQLQGSDILLNHPTVEGLHAGISEIEGYFHLINLSTSSATMLNGRAIPFNEAKALSSGDEIQIGPYFLHIEEIEESTETLKVKVMRQFALNVGERETHHQAEARRKHLAEKEQIAASPKAADALKLYWDKRSREKAGRPSLLHPQTPPRPGKVRFNWRPTRDLVRSWPFSIFILAIIIVGALSALAAYKYKNAFTRKPLSIPHTRKAFTLTPAIAKQPSAGSCTSCHAMEVSVTNREKMNASCANCHQTEAFSATITRAHRDSGITCIDCHTEHKGESFRPMDAALESCAKCHSDSNKNLYNGRGVHTPHDGTYGYPVVKGHWVWKGLDEEELAEEPELLTLLKNNRVTREQTEQWRNVQFHGIHLYRVRVPTGVVGIEDVNAVNGELSCSSCHKYGNTSTNIDRTSPRTTCAKCHNDQVFHKSAHSMVGMEMPSCTSCHVQHVRDRHWLPSLFSTQAGGMANSDE